jgi:hypothetical protein
MNTVYRYRVVLLAHNGQESVNVSCPRYYREDLSDSSSYEPTFGGWSSVSGDRDVDGRANVLKLFGFLVRFRITLEL